MSGETMMGAPGVLPTDEDEINELRALGITIREGPDGPITTHENSDVAGIIGAAAMYFRRIRGVVEERAITEAAKAIELAQVERVYGAELAAADRRIEYFEARIRDLARMADSVGALEKKKTLKTAWGDFGKRTKAERAEIADQNMALTWAERTVPDAVRVTVQLPLSDVIRLVADAGYVPAGWVEKKREVLISALEAQGIDPLHAAEPVPGIVRHEATTEWVVKPAKAEG